MAHYFLDMLDIIFLDMVSNIIDINFPIIRLMMEATRRDVFDWLTSCVYAC
jgi:hypothetical protein